MLEVLDLNKLQSICRVKFFPCRLLCSKNDMKLKDHIENSSFYLRNFFSFTSNFKNPLITNVISNQEQGKAWICKKH